MSQTDTATTVSVTVNGEARELSAGATLGDLLAELSLPIEGVAVAVWLFSQTSDARADHHQTCPQSQ